MSLVNMVDFVAQYLAWIRGLVVQRGSYEAGFVGRTINFGSYLYLYEKFWFETRSHTFANRSTDAISNFQDVDLVVP